MVASYNRTHKIHVLVGRCLAYHYGIPHISRSNVHICNKLSILFLIKEISYNIMIVTISIAIQSIIYYINTLEAGKLRQVKWPVCICI